jgi:hypothetical protein
MFRVEDHQHTPVGAEPTALEVGQQVLTHPRVLGRAVPHAERVFLAVSRDAERHDQAGLADMDSVDQQPHQVHRVERGGLPRRQRRPRLRDKAATERSCWCPGCASSPAPAPGSAHTAAWRRPRASARPRVDSTDRRRPWLEMSAAAPPGPLPARAVAARPPCVRPTPLRCSRCRRRQTVGVMRVTRAAQRRPILFEHRFQHLQARSDRELEPLGPASTSRSTSGR